MSKLPVVTEEVSLNTAMQLFSNFEALKEQMRAENPKVYDAMAQAAEVNATYGKMVMDGAVATYFLLRNQAEADA